MTTPAPKDTRNAAPISRAGWNRLRVVVVGMTGSSARVDMAGSLRGIRCLHARRPDVPIARDRRSRFRTEQLADRIHCILQQHPAAGIGQNAKNAMLRQNFGRSSVCAIRVRM
ncbi:hypothetical protein GCM10009573_21360 [Agromyces bracchium]